MKDNFMYDIVSVRLMVAKDELNAENHKIYLMLEECKREHVQPPKDYWLRQDQLKNKIKTLTRLLESYHKPKNPVPESHARNVLNGDV